MTRRAEHTPYFSHKHWLTVVYVSMMFGATTFPPLGTPQVRAQSPLRQVPRPPTFDVALIIPSRNRGAESNEPAWGEFMAREVTTRYLIEYAYDINPSGRASSDDQLVGGPEWIDFEKYDVDAKVEDSFAKRMRKFPPEQMEEQMRLMLQSLLTDQFSLRVHHESKNRPVYALLPAEGGVKFLQARLAPGSDGLDSEGKDPPPPPAGRRRLLLHGSMSQLALMLSRDPDIGRTVLDQTGIKGNYECALDWPQAPDRNDHKLSDGKGYEATWDSPLAGDPPGPPIFTALKEQLGLKLESITGPVDVIVIDYIERPSQN